MADDEMREAARRILDEWDRPSPISDAIEHAIGDAPRPWPDGTPTYAEPVTPSQLGERSPAEPNAYVTLGRDGEITAIRHRGEDY